MIKDKIAQLIAGKLNDDQKRQMIQAFYDSHKHDINIDKLIQDMKNALNYEKDDVPKR
jgi:hypothetical protein